jgi:hypothetical protein
MARVLGQYDATLKVFAVEGERTQGRYTWISHILSSGSETAGQARWRYRCTGDEAWLRKVAYPLFVEITSRLGEECRVRNPWRGKVQVRREGEAARRLEGDILTFDTDAGTQYPVIPAGAPEPKAIAIKPQPAEGPISFE